jgi:hypothetical protein
MDFNLNKIYFKDLIEALIYGVPSEIDVEVYDDNHQKKQTKKVEFHSKEECLIDGTKFNYYARDHANDQNSTTIFLVPIEQNSIVQKPVFLETWI